MLPDIEVVCSLISLVISVPLTPRPPIFGEKPRSRAQTSSGRCSRGRLGASTAATQARTRRLLGRGHPASAESSSPTSPQVPCSVAGMWGVKNSQPLTTVTPPPPQPRVGFSLPGPRDGKWVVRAAVHSVLGVPLPCVCAGRRGGAVTKGWVPSRSRTTPRRSCFPFWRMCRRASAGSVAEREGAAGSVPTSCPRLPGGPGPGRHGPSGAAQVSWGGRVPEMLLLGRGGGPALREMGLSSEVTILSDILTLLLMKTVTLACRVIYCRILCSDSRISKSYDVLHMNLFAIDIPT